MLKTYYKKENVYVKVVITIRSCVPAWMLVIGVMGGQGRGRLARDAVRHITMMRTQRYKPFSVAGGTPTSLAS